MSINFYNVDYIYVGGRFIGCGKLKIDKQKPMQPPKVLVQASQIVVAISHVETSVDVYSKLAE